ncbi:23S rRNA pseudouridine1911/1915/1917 synthase [Methylomarinovum caldicuralii]|uniref:Pseudouridine synthase n=1 Tax=Methylomarinovum caldicuralii TaxID=438856 RepID=A0AAU9C3B5_9GAMM|nr:23S rRNA pseudouridine(1911/1915/1917) synthase RluD [Methylomarinovum caldicuralii]BCX82937.1 23S rRNA pseudouridine1911/1915/1917 synthase [Methylomarinovum caldicuralii]
MTTPITRTASEELAGLRLDQALARLFPDYSRSCLKRWIEAGRVTVDGETRRPRDRLAGGETIELYPAAEIQAEDLPQDIPLDIVFEDEDLIVLDKPAGLVVHPAAGHHDGTLVNALLHHAPELAELPRAGIVHRIDKDTTGLMVVAKSLRAHTSLVAQLQARSVKRRYLALAQGWVTAGGTVNAPIGRHPLDRKRFAVTPTGKEAITHYRIAERFPHHTLLRVSLETGRTHQIRVHMAHLRHPLVGDPLYGRLRLPLGASEALIQTLRNFRRQALHAEKLTLIHPATNREMSWKAPLPDDFAALLEALRRAYAGDDDHDGDGWEMIWPTD